MDKMYCKNEDDDLCTYLFNLLDDARCEGLETIELIEYVKDAERNKREVWCMEYSHSVHKPECNRDCPLFHKTGGRFCDFRGFLYKPFRKVMFDVRTGKEIQQ